MRLPAGRRPIPGYPLWAAWYETGTVTRDGTVTVHVRVNRWRMVGWAIAIGRVRAHR